MSYSVYIVECSDGTYYTGVAKDLTARVYAHNHETQGAKYTKARRPVRLVYSEEALDRSMAQQREYAIRTLTRNQKENLIKNNNDRW